MPECKITSIIYKKRFIYLKYRILRKCWVSFWFKHMNRCWRKSTEHRPQAKLRQTIRRQTGDILYLTHLTSRRDILSHLEVGFIKEAHPHVHRNAKGRPHAQRYYEWGWGYLVLVSSGLLIRRGSPVKPSMLSLLTLMIQAHRNSEHPHKESTNSQNTADKETCCTYDSTFFSCLIMHFCTGKKCFAEINWCINITWTNMHHRLNTKQEGEGELTFSEWPVIFVLMCAVIIIITLLISNLLKIGLESASQTQQQEKNLTCHHIT